MNKFVILVLVFVIFGIGYWKHKQHIQIQALAAEQERQDMPRSDQEIRQAIRDSLNNNNNAAYSPNTNSNPVANEIRASAPSGFKCDGRTTCSQMTSCQEATFFLQNCPGVKMDGGDGKGHPDGVPCEAQWCGD